MLPMLCSLLWLFHAFADAAEIMRRVAENQTREQATRNQFIYQQVIHRTARYKNGKLIKEEFWTYTVAPNAKGTEKKLISVKGRYLKNGAYLPFEGEPVPEVGLLSVVFDDNDSPTRDGLDSDLFPLTSEKQKEYTLEYAGGAHHQRARGLSDPISSERPA